MRYLNIACAYCNQPFAENDDVVTCPDCGTPQHRACWQEKGCCANAHLHAQGFVWRITENGSQTNAPVKTQEELHVPAAPADQTVECPFCGAQNYANELYCTVCHEPIHQNASADAGEPLQDEEQREKMYADFRTYGGLDPQSNVGEISVKEYSAYVGETSGSYIRRFMVMHKRDNILSWNWAACWTAAIYMIVGVMCGPAWFFYRKMNKYGAIFLGILAAVGLAGALVYASDPAYWELTDRTYELYMSYAAQLQQAGADMTQLINDLTLNLDNAAATYWENCSKLTYTWSYVSDLIYSFALPALSGLFATGLYFKKAKKDILSVREMHGANPDYLQRIKAKGGVSVGRAVLGVVACAVIHFLMQMLPFLLRSIGILQ